MATATMTSKGQVTIPKEVREALGLEAGSKLFFLETSLGYVMRVKDRSVRDLHGFLKYDGPPATIEEMDRSVGEYLGEDDERIKRGRRG